jgi:hypothetical protein
MSGKKVLCCWMGNTKMVGINVDNGQWSDGRSYVAEWESGVPYGKGEMTWPDAGGRMMKGKWRHGEIVSGKVWTLVRNEA